MADFFSLADASSRIHLIGVAGSGMSGIAALLLDLGYRVSGSDKVTTVETERLQGKGLEFFCPHTAESVHGAGMVVFSSAIKKGNVAYDEAERLGIPLFRRAEALAAIMRRKKGIVIAGMHGKTTTSSMCAHVLRAGEMHPSHYVGAEIPLLGTNAFWDNEGDHFVAEGDESDGTIALFHPEHAILLNVEEEHLDHYRNLDEIKDTFRKLLQQTCGRIYFCGSDAGAADVCHGRRGAVSYGWEETNDFAVKDLEMLGQSTAFTVVRRGESLGRMILNIPGRHNVLNALAVTALASDLGVSFERIAWALETFRGAKRRFEVKLRTTHFTVVDDYGHHPTEIAATLATARNFADGQGRKRVVCIFQPHRYTRTQLLRKEFGRAFAHADAVFVLDVYAASEPPIPGISGQTVVDEIEAVEGDRVKVRFLPDREVAHHAVGNFLREGDLLITLGAGNVHEIGTRLTEDLLFMEEMSTALADPEATVRLYEPMSRHTTLLIGGPAQYWLEPRSIEAFSRIIKRCREDGIPIRVVGRGSNLLVRDGGIRGAVIHPSGGEFDEIRREGDTLTCGVGVRFKKLAWAARSANLGGFEWMEGIPGNVGGCLRMNAGAMGAETFDRIVSVRCLDASGELFEKTRKQIAASYRNVPEFATNYTVSATFRGISGVPHAEIDRRIEESKAKRRTSQPIAASAGCIFKNPPEIPAGKLVEELGFKECRSGAAQVSPVHGNFIVNGGGATAREVLDLIDQIKKAAREQRGIAMETEVQIIGQDAAV
ncbi:MAG: UDP-N-acetylmuramate--L-alanine ligase [Verrucomicrobiales bacterium]|nr:UDP-N-acetylmuramate--L-alanine ligase [Verrucomicrobiales bacterium]